MLLFTCVFCREEKDYTNFYKDRSKKTGYRPRCKKCDLLSRDKKKRAEYEKKYWDKRRNDKRKIVLKSYYANIDHHKKKRKQYLKTDSGKSKHRKYNQNRRSRLKNAFVEEVEPIEIYREQDGVCYLCGKFLEFSDIELDHVVPLSRGGLHEKSNIRIACVRCNRSKGSKLLKEVRHQVV